MFEYTQDKSYVVGLTIYLVIITFLILYWLQVCVLVQSAK